MLSCLKDSHSPSLGTPGEFSSQEVSGVRAGGRTVRTTFTDL